MKTNAEYEEHEAARLFPMMEETAFESTLEIAEARQRRSSRPAVQKTYDGEIEMPAMVKKLSKFPGGASALLGAAKRLRQLKQQGSTSLTRCVAERVVDVYNANRKTGKLDPL